MPTSYATNSYSFRDNNLLAEYIQYVKEDPAQDGNNQQWVKDMFGPIDDVWVQANQEYLAQAEVDAYSQAATLAQQRSDDATANAKNYADSSSAAAVHQALAAQMSGGGDGNADVVNSYAAVMISGSYSLSTSRGTLVAAEQLTASRLNQAYEVDSMQRQAKELKTAADQANAELATAQARAQATRAGVFAAQARAEAAGDVLTSFDEQAFTPEIWQRMGDALFRLYQRYLVMALRTARLMQQAYNFETDQDLQLIRTDYVTDEVKGLLAADALMADIQSFSYDLVTSTRGKAQPLKQTISLAQRLPHPVVAQRAGVLVGKSATQPQKGWLLCVSLCIPLPFLEMSARWQGPSRHLSRR